MAVVTVKSDQETHRQTHTEPHLMGFPSETGRGGATSSAARKEVEHSALVSWFPVASPDIKTPNSLRVEIRLFQPKRRRKPQWETVKRAERLEQHTHQTTTQ